MLTETRDFNTKEDIVNFGVKGDLASEKIEPANCVFCFSGKC